MSAPRKRARLHAMRRKSLAESLLGTGSGIEAKE
jgi:hypothetical protein